MVYLPYLAPPPPTQYLICHSKTQQFVPSHWQ